MLTPGSIYMMQCCGIEPQDVDVRLEHSVTKNNRSKRKIARTVVETENKTESSNQKRRVKVAVYLQLLERLCTNQ